MVHRTSEERTARLEARIQAVGSALGSALAALVDALPGTPCGPQQLSARLGIDKVFASRLLKAVAGSEPLVVLHHVPGPEPLRRLVRASARTGLSPALLLEAERAIDEFSDLLRNEVGDRGALDAILSSWLPEAREEFESRRKQAAFRAMSELKGSCADVDLSIALVGPSRDRERADLAWVVGMLGLRRLRPEVPVRFTRRRLLPNGVARPSVPFDGARSGTLEVLRLDAFCAAPPAELRTQRIEHVAHHTLEGCAFGPLSEVDLLFAEIHRAELPRFAESDSDRRPYVYSVVTIPSRRLVFDVLVHEDVYPGVAPELFLYDTSNEGVADPNDRAREADRMSMNESVRELGTGLQPIGGEQVPQYVEMLQYVHARVGWDPEAFHAYRCRVDHPLLGSQVAFCFDPPSPAG